jgi:hypothetical protein
MHRQFLLKTALAEGLSRHELLDLANDPERFGNAHRNDSLPRERKATEYAG